MQRKADHPGWNLAHGTDEPMLSVSLLVKPHGEAAGAAQAYAGYVAEFGEAAVPEPVDGLGGAAGWDADTGQLTVFEGPYQIILTENGRFAGDRLSFGRQMADRILTRLPKP